jgi:hypothetical protein
MGGQKESPKIFAEVEWAGISISDRCVSVLGIPLADLLADQNDVIALNIFKS